MGSSTSLCVGSSTRLCLCGQQHAWLPAKQLTLWEASHAAAALRAARMKRTHGGGNNLAPFLTVPSPTAHTAAATGAGCTMCPFCSSAAWARTCWPSACGTQRCAAPVWSLLPPALAMACCARTFGAACSPPAPYQDRLSFELAVSGRMYQQAALQPDLRCAAPPAPAMHPTNHSDLRLPNELRPHYTLN